MITGYELIEKMYSENYDEYEDTRLYRTGDDELDDLLENEKVVDGFKGKSSKYICEKYNWDETNKQIMNLYHEVVNVR